MTLVFGFYFLLNILIIITFMKVPRTQTFKYVIYEKNYFYFMCHG